MKKVALLVLLILQGCTSQDAQLIKTLLVSDIFKKHHDVSISYNGYAFDALINDVPVIEISNKDTIKSLKGYRDIASVRWQLLKPINHLTSTEKLVVTLKRRRIKEHEIGKIKAYEVAFHPLNDMKIKTKRVRVENKTILVQGHPMVSYEEVMETLPIGDYVISLTARGSENWDRKEIFMEVRETNVTDFL